MLNITDKLINTLSTSFNEIDIKLTYINNKINKLHKHIIYIYLILLLNTLLNLIFIFK